MTSDNELQKVKKFRSIRKRKLLLLIFFSCLGTICGRFLWHHLLDLTDFSVNIALLTVGGTAIGFYIGNLFSRYLENNTEFFVAMLIISILHVPIFSISVNLYKTFKSNLNDNIALLIFGIAVIICIPALMYIILRDMSYCENCKKSYKSITVFSSKTVSPYKILSLLQNKQKFPNVSDLEEDEIFPRYKKDNIQIEVTANYCPHCYNAIVNSELSYEVGVFGKEKRRILFYSDFWTGELFKKVFSIENNIIQAKETDTFHYHNAIKQITPMEFCYSKLRLCKILLPLIIGVAMFSFLLFVGIRKLSDEITTKDICSIQ